MDEDDDAVKCPACNAEQPHSEALMGVLGNRVHFRCRYCGMEFSHLYFEPATDKAESE